MARYDAQLAGLKSVLPNAKNILIALPRQSDIDKFAAALALFLSFEDQGKQISIVCDDTVRVAQSHLFGIDHVRNAIAQSAAGNYILTLGGVAVPDPSGVGGKVPALEKLDYFVEGNNLNLVFNVLPGQTFAPNSLTPRYQGSGIDVIFVVGAASLIDLGNIHQQSSSVFSGPHIVNIDNETDNAMFGQTNVVDSSSSSVSEIVTDVINDLSLPFDQDMGTNLLAGIFDATNNLQNPNVGADTYLSVSTCIRVGGKKPQGGYGQPAGQGLDLSAFVPQPQAAPVAPTAPVVPAPVQSSPQADFFNPASPSNGFFGSPERPSSEERPAGEAVISEGESESSFEPGWLTPKVFKGTSVG